MQQQDATQILTEVCYTRWTEEAGGPYPVVVHSSPKGKHYELARGNAPETFRTWKGVVTAVHGSRFTARHWPKARYLKKGPWLPGKAEPDFDLVGPPSPLAPGTSIVWTPTPPKLWEPPTILVRSKPGIDLDARGHEVAKLLYKGFRSWILTQGFEFQDVLQEVYRKILVANQGSSPWTPEKSTFGHYVHMVCRSALSNIHRKSKRVATREQIGVKSLGPDGTWQDMDVAACRSRHVADHRVPTVDPVKDLQTFLLSQHQGHPDATLAASLVPYVQAGHTLKESAALLGVDRPRVSKAMKLLRSAASAWAN